MDLGAKRQFFSAMQGAGGGGFCTGTCNGANPLQIAMAVTSKRVPERADLLQWTVGASERWSVHKNALEMI